MLPPFTMKEGGFAVADYVVFLILCIASCSGGLYYSAVGSKKKTVKDIKDYLLGGKTMSTFPVAMSLIASYVSGVTILGTPAEIYNYGAQYWLVVVGVCLSCVCVATVYLPVFYTLRLSSSYELSRFQACLMLFLREPPLQASGGDCGPCNSGSLKKSVGGCARNLAQQSTHKTFMDLHRLRSKVLKVAEPMSYVTTAEQWRIIEDLNLFKHALQIHYLELRFNRHVRAVASILFLLDEILFLPMVVYVPALAFNQLTGFNVLAVGGVMVLICGLYTVLGGLRAVVWTDTMQTIIMFAGVVTVAIAGTIALGGVGYIIDIAKQSHRVDLSNWSFNPLERQTGWGALVGGFLYWTCFNSVNQTMVQRYIALPSKKKTIHALIIFCCGAVFAISSCVWCGLTAWAAWVKGGCTPSGVPLVDDRLLPAFVTYVSSTMKLPGLAGIFLAGVFGAGLSSLSCILNACALVVVEDLLRGWLRVRLKPFKEGLIARSVSGVLAIMSILLLVVIEKLGGVLGVATALSAIAASATCGIFTLGMACWWVGPRGAVAGGVAGALTAGAVSVGTQAAAARGYRWPPLGMTDECARNATYVPQLEYLDPTSIFPLFRVSYHWIAPLGLAATLVVGSCVGYMLDAPARVPLDAELFTPAVHRWLPRAARDNAGATRRARAARADPPPAAPLILGLIDKDLRESSGS